MSDATPRPRLFLSYGRRDAEELAERLEQDLVLCGYDVWRDTRQIRAGQAWEDEIVDGLRSTQLVVALLSPHAVRKSGDPENPDDVDSVCLDELSFARFQCRRPIVPVLALPCEPPFVIFRLDYVDLLRWRDSAEAYRCGFQRLRQAIDAGLRGEVRYRVWEDRLRPFDFADFLFAKRHDFCGRGWLFERIDRWRSEPDRARALLITGDPGIGKSAIVAQLIHANPGGQVLAHHCCQHASRETLRPGRFVRSLAAQIASQLEGYAAQLDKPEVEAALSEGRCAQDPFSAFEEGLLAPLHALHAPDGGARYLLIDALDEALAYREGPTIVDLLAARLERLPGWLRVVATSRKEPEILRRLGGLRAEELRADDPHNLDDLKRFLAHRLGHPTLRAHLDAAGLAPAEAIRRLRDRSGGNFLWASQELLGLESGASDFARLEALPPGLGGLYLGFFERHFPDAASYAPTRSLLEAVLAAREPLSAPEIAEATGLDTDYELPPLLDRLAAYLPDRDGRRAPYHKSLADWLTATTDPRPAGRFFVSPTRGQKRLVDWSWTSYRNGLDRMPPYPLRHLPAHLRAAGRLDDLAAVLLDLPYLEARAESGDISNLAMDFTQAVAALPVEHRDRHHLRLIEQAIRFDLHFLSRHPSALFQCLWNRCWWHDAPEAAAYCDRHPRGRFPEGTHWSRPEPGRLSTRLEAWRAAKEQCQPGFAWLRSLRPPLLALEGSQFACPRGHEGVVSSVAFDADGRLASGSWDRTVRLWDARTGVDLACLRGHEGPVSSVAFDGEGRLASGSYDGTVRLWDVTDGTCLEVIRGSGDISAIVPGTDRFPYRAINRGGETVVEPTAGGAPVAWFPDGLGSIKTHPSGRIWAGYVSNHVCLIRLEGLGEAGGSTGVAGRSDSGG